MHTGTSLAGAKDAGVDDRRFRLLALAVLCSLALHALALLFLAYLGDFSRARGAPPPLTAHLARPKPSPEPPAVQPPQLPVPRAAPYAKQQLRPAPVRVPVPAALSPASKIELSKQAEEPAVAAPAAPAPPVARAEVQTLPAAASGPDPASVARYRLELMEIAARYERYPRIARENDWEGRVDLLVTFAESGAIASMSVKKGTGRAVLDEEAQAIIRSAQPHAVMPPALRGRAFALDIAVIFRLKK